MNLPVTLIFLCTGNSCRSIIGEALANHLGHGALRGLSAGSAPTGQVNPNALAVLQRHGVPVGAPDSKPLDALQGESIDLVITVCDAAAGESCPIWLGSTPKVHWGLPDPAHVTGSEATVRTAFEKTFEALRLRIEQLLQMDLTRLNVAELMAAAQTIHDGAGDH